MPACRGPILAAGSGVAHRVRSYRRRPDFLAVIPANAGIHFALPAEIKMDDRHTPLKSAFRFRGNDVQGLSGIGGGVNELRCLGEGFSARYALARRRHQRAASAFTRQPPPALNYFSRACRLAARSASSFSRSLISRPRSTGS